MKERDCANCKHHTEDGCSSWDCEFEKAMTREEAIAILEVSKHMATSGRLYNQAIDMAIEALQREEADMLVGLRNFKEYIRGYNSATGDAVQGWNNHEVACILAELFGDACACNYNGIDEWLPMVCDLKEICPDTYGVACLEQFLKHYGERREP